MVWPMIQTDPMEKDSAAACGSISIGRVPKGAIDTRRGHRGPGQSFKQPITVIPQSTSEHHPKSVPSKKLGNPGDIESGNGNLR